jgi:ubiquinone/menaquinone biosynthesis C-methylase UbiE
LNVEIEWGDINNIQFADSYFDLVCAFDVLEHISTDAQALGELSRVCKSEGSILLTVPAFNFVWSAHDEINHHFRRYSINQLKGLCSKKEELDIEFISYFNFLLFIPISLYRIFSNVFSIFKKRREIKSDFSDQGLVMSTIFKYLFRFDKWFILRQIKLPFGLSIICHIRKLE